MPAQAIRIDPALAGQAAFRAVMDAMSRPGEIRPLATTIRPPAPIKRAVGAIICALIDFETPVWLDASLASRPEVVTWLRFETGAPLTREQNQAFFAVLTDTLDMPSFSDFALGNDDYPDRSATLILQVDELGAGAPLRLTGPGLAHARRFCATPLPADFVDRLQANRVLFPRGIDIILASDDAVAALPRSVRAEHEEN